MNYFSGQSILIISTEDWGHIPISKHHYSRELTRIGATVFFLNPPSRQNRIYKHDSIQNLFIIDYITIKGINGLPEIFRDLLNGTLIRRVLKLVGRNIDVVWSFDPYRFQNLSLFKAKLRIYHPVDFHLSKLEKQAAKTADLIISVSDLILKGFMHFHCRKIKIDHGLQSHFIQANLPQFSSQIETIGYVGNLDNWCIDRDTLLKIIDENKNSKFLFIGPYANNSVLARQLLQYNNCTLIGRVPSEELPNYFSKIDLFLMCYDGSNKVVNSNHHKILEFISTGKPSVINYTDEYSGKSDLVIMSQNNYELPALVKQVIHNYKSHITNDLVMKRIKWAKEYTYEAQVYRISKVASEILQLR